MLSIDGLNVQHSFSFLIFILIGVNTARSSDLLCRTCGHTITTASALKNIKSDSALYSYNMTVVGIEMLVQVFQNPVPETFHVITATGANLKFTGKSYAEHTWFTGKRWTACVCSKCATHIGWYFESPDDNFVSLILDYMISAEYADTLTLVNRP